MSEFWKFPNGSLKSKTPDLAFEVEDEVVQQLVTAGLVVVEGEEKDMLRMVDLTCST